MLAMQLQIGFRDVKADTRADPFGRSRSITMIRKFKLEAEIYESLNCLPMAAVGIKLHLAQWGQLGRGERLMICHAPADS
jgi:hypothetical protein